ncbi:MAG: cytochrome c biogenesis protein CcsA [Alistipes sp.]|nr:cytochrome c biogenesis protein CcsA [Alistipes sp.]
MQNAKLKPILKLLSFGTLAIIVVAMMGATIVEKMHGTELVLSKIYTAPWMIVLWGVSAISALAYIVTCGIHRRWRILLLHLSFAVILVGALTTHLTGREGAIRIREGESVTTYQLRGGGSEELGFELTLDDFELKFYEGTFAPMDYISHITISDTKGEHKGEVSMNNIVRHRGHRIYQSGYDPDAKGSTLMITYDPYGIVITYIGYAMLLFACLVFFLEPNSMFRALLRHPALRRLSAIVLLATLSLSGFEARAEASSMPKTLSKEAADAFCDICVYHNDRIAPLETLAVEFTSKLYGKAEYRGLSAEQVLTGWFFFYEDWKLEPMIKIKGGDIAQILGIEGKYARLVDYMSADGYKLDKALRGEAKVNRQNAELANEKFNLVSMLCMGTLLKIYPYTDAEGECVWYSLADPLPQDMPHDEALFIHKGMNLVAEAAMSGDYATIQEFMGNVALYQRKRAEAMPSESRLSAEKLYNAMNYNRPLAMFCLTLGIICFILLCNVRNSESRVMRCMCGASYVVLSLLLLYLSLHIGLRYYISGHIPLANGYETMQFMSWCSVVLTLAVGRKFRMALPFGLLVAGFTLLVAMLGEASPRITQLMPVLQSPLLSIHVMVIMISYTLLAFTLLNGITAVVLHLTRGKEAASEIEYLSVVSRIMLYPAVMLLAIGIFIGAVWANVSWGRYWGWDPKEVWALITMLIYAALIHSGSLGALRKPMTLHILTIVAFLAVLITYFGVNFILGGMHSYA